MIIIKCIRPFRARIFKVTNYMEYLIFDVGLEDSFSYYFIKFTQYNYITDFDAFIK